MRFVECQRLLGDHEGPDGAIYGVPAGHPCMLQIHPASRTANTIPGGFKDELMWPGWKWSGGFVHPGTGTLFCIPTNSHSVLAFGPIPDGLDPEPGDGHIFRSAGLSSLRTQSLGLEKPSSVQQRSFLKNGREGKFVVKLMKLLIGLR